MDAEHKSKGIALLLAIALGAIGLPGIGLIYLGKIKVGLLVLFLDFIVFVAMLATFIGSASLLGLEGLGIGILVGVALVIFYIGAWIWAIIYTNSQTDKYNQHVKEHGSPPW